ncbi:MAG: endo-1,4-beta-xylanase [Oscillospiraceae bacterium]|nr:endo-1,4-beta-xylanase [Oscillospiraceae bacterium]
MKKRISALILSMIIVLSLTPLMPVSAETFTTADALAILRDVVGTQSLTDAQRAKFGFEADYTVQTSDALKILRIIVGSETVNETPPVPPKANPTTLIEAYGDIFDYVGAAAYNWHWVSNAPYSLSNPKVLDFAKKHFNSLTAENEMKIENILNFGNLITVEEAKNRGYFIPAGFTETHFPAIQTERLNDYLKIAYENGFGVRFHSFTYGDTERFFRANYNTNENYVSKAVMEKRLEMYVKSIIKLVYESKYGEVVYAWDVFNEYLHLSNDSGLFKIYGSDKSYIINSFKFAHEQLTAMKIRDNVGLIYNDFNEYDIADEIINLIKEINKGGKYCDGVGMQMHLDVSGPNIGHIGNAIDKFKAEGFEIQITELDVTLNGQWSSGTKTAADQAQYYGDVFKMLVEKKNGGANITGITFWGLCDSNSWRGEYTPLLFTDIDKPKTALFNAVMNAAK